MAQVTENFNGGHGRNVSQSTVHCTLLRMGLRSRRPVRVPMMTPVHRRKSLQWARERRNWTLEQWKKVSWSNESHFRLDHVDGRLRVEVMAPGCTVGRRQAGGGSAMLWAMFCWETLSGHSCGRQFDTCHLPKHRCRPGTPLHGNGIP